ncbi:uncharacterized protein LOC143891208 [Tasmannia lanceolata]|uniref:uncharacterized protein LOC143891208 n=1 Tax=Tasmannia lanceolata TaxID=3420 RepID=UPI0040636728
MFNHNATNIAIRKPEASGKFSSKSAWNAVRLKTAITPWSSTIWFKGAIPKHSIVSWKAIINKLSTTDRLSFLNSGQNRRCILCSTEPETVNHLFFNCGFSSWIWRSILWRIGTQRRLKKNVAEEEQWIRDNFTGEGQRTTALKYGFQPTIYHIWRERNSRLFENKVNHKTQILRHVIQDIKVKINDDNRRDTPNDANRKAAHLFR